MRPAQISDKRKFDPIPNSADSESKSSEETHRECSEPYIDRAKEIVAERTPDEEKYDREVIGWLRRGKRISKAIAKANQKYPKEALQVNNDNLAEVEAYYEYLAEHETIMENWTPSKVGDPKTACDPSAEDQKLSSSL